MRRAIAAIAVCGLAAAANLPAQGRVRNADIQEDVLVKIVLADQQLMHAGEKTSGLRALYDPVIVCAADRDGLADSELRQRFWSHRLIFRRILDRARRNDY